MKKSSIIWKELPNLQADKSFTSRRSKSKSQRYTPVRSKNSSEHYDSIKLLRESKLNMSEIGASCVQDSKQDKENMCISVLGVYSPKATSQGSLFSGLKKKDPVVRVSV